MFVPALRIALAKCATPLERAALERALFEAEPSAHEVIAALARGLAAPGNDGA